MRLASSPWSVLIFFVLLYGSTASHSLQGGDASEFMTIAGTGGVAHPPGYPLFSLMLRAFGWLPVLDLPWRASVASGVLMAGAMALLYDATRRLSSSTAAALITVGILGMSPGIWRYATVAEVFAGCALTGMAVLWVSVRIAQGWHGWPAAGALGLAVASGIANHHTVVLLAPLALWAFWRCLPRPLAPRRVLACIGACAGAQLLGLGSYLVLMLPGGAWRWGDTHTLGGLVHHFLRRDYGTFALGLTEEPVMWWEHPLVLLRELPANLAWVGVLLALLGLLALGERKHRGLLVAMLATLALAGPVFLARFNLGTADMMLVVARRFHILPTLLLAPLMGLGCARLIRLQPRLLASGLAAVVALHGLTALSVASHLGWTVLEDYARNTFRVLEPDAVVFITSDNFHYASTYLQGVEGLRSDVTFIHPGMVGYPWYRSRLGAAHPDLPAELLDKPRSLQDMAARARQSRPTYLAFAHLDGERAADFGEFWPVGAVLARLASPDMPAPPTATVARAMAREWERHTLQRLPATHHECHNTWEAWAADQYVTGWLALASGQASVEDWAGWCQSQALAATIHPLVQLPDPPQGAPAGLTTSGRCGRP